MGNMEFPASKIKFFSVIFVSPKVLSKNEIRKNIVIRAYAIDRWYCITSKVARFPSRLEIPLQQHRHLDKLAVMILIAV